MAEAILTVNAGSSSIKFALFEAAAPLPRLAAGAVEGIGTAPRFRVRDAAGLPVHEHDWQDGALLSHEELLGPVLDWIDQHLGQDRLVAAGHRIVHGGAEFTQATRLDGACLARLAKLNSLAPLHQPHNLAAVAAVVQLRPNLPQIGCFDTGFHRTMPEISTRLALPRSLRRDGVRRYGFHGLSYEYIAGEFARLYSQDAAGRVVALHLGNGASVCAMQAGESVDCSTGFTALDGLIMGTRCGAIDPGVVLHLIQAHGMTTDDVTSLLYTKSGLLGISGLSADMHILITSQTAGAAEAIESFTLAAAKQVAALATSLGGLDAMIFTAGVGEHAPVIRAAICARLHWLGIRIDPAANAANSQKISQATSALRVYVIPTDEETMIAKHCMRFTQRPLN
jgi:acetate kinase